MWSLRILKMLYVVYGKIGDEQSRGPIMLQVEIIRTYWRVCGFYRNEQRQIDYRDVPPVVAAACRCQDAVSKCPEHNDYWYLDTSMGPPITDVEFDDLDDDIFELLGIYPPFIPQGK